MTRSILPEFRSDLERYLEEQARAWQAQPAESRVPQICVANGRRVLSSGRMIRNFLANHVPGLGPTRAQRLWDTFGDNLPDVLCRDEALAHIGQVMSPDKPILGLRLAVLASTAWGEAKSEGDLVVWLDKQGITDVSLVRRLHRIFGTVAATVLEDNPFTLVPLLPWCTVDTIGTRLLRERGVSRPMADCRRLVGAADELVKRCLHRGDTAIETGTAIQELSRLLGVPTDHALINLAIDTALRNSALASGDECFRAPGASAMEDMVVKRLTHLRASQSHSPVSGLTPSRQAELLACTTDPYRPLDDAQRAAALRLLQSPLACLQGGAGTGKTHICRAICDAWEATGGSVVLCALAGKAALRLSRATTRPAKTLARTLAELDERESLEQKPADTVSCKEATNNSRAYFRTLTHITDRTLVIVDEASMVDLPTMYSLTKHMPEGSRLLLVGDEAQLPPIGFGLVFHKLVDDLTITARLSRVHRHAENTGIAEAAALIRQGDIPSFDEYAGRNDGVSGRPDTWWVGNKILHRLGGNDERYGGELGESRR